MKLIKLSEEHYIVVDDSEIKQGDWYYIPRTHSVYQCEEDPTELNLERHVGTAKVTHSTQKLYANDFWAIRELKLSEVKELLGVVDVEKKVKGYVEELIDCKSVKESERTWISAICHQMYIQAHEENKERKYTEDDLRKAIDMAQKESWDEGGYLGKEHEPDEIIQTLQPKTEWEVEFVDGRLTLV